MRRSIAAVVVALSLAVSVGSATPSSAASSAGDERRMAEPAADTALTQAIDVLAGEGTAAGPSATLALRDLFVALPALDPAERKQARGVLARPTDGPNDPQGQGYTVPAKRKCNKRICMHWVNSTDDAPPDRQWVKKNLRVMTRTWTKEVGKLNYRRPVKDGNRGGNAKFDVYLKELGSQGLYGYCAPERRKRGFKWIASGYCVLDDDFAKEQYGVRPMKSLRVTAAHEFFHAIQFAYDYAEDRWFMEATATWMEERVADDVNDNRQYLQYGQVKNASSPLDVFNSQGFNQYGNWAFFEYLSTRFGKGVVRAAWNKAGTFRGAPDKYSTAAVKAAVRRPGFTKVFRDYAAANTAPGRSYPEGGKWPSAGITQGHTLTKDARRANGAVRVSHMASRNIAITPGSGLGKRKWFARLTINAPNRKVAPAAMVTVHKKNGKVQRKAIGLNRKGFGRAKFRFNARGVEKATITLVNASTRFNCWEQRFTYSCQGIPKDDNKLIEYALKMIKR